MMNENLRKLRMSKKMTQEDLAQHLNVSRQSIAKWENGESLPDINKCKQLAHLFDVTLDHLVDTITNETGEIKAPPGKYLFGTVKVSERGQIVIPKQARDVFNIQSGDRLLMLGDKDQGIAIVKLDEISQFLKSIINAPLIEEGEDDESS